jgi:hypothetical protein
MLLRVALAFLTCLSTGLYAQSETSPSRSRAAESPVTEWEYAAFEHSLQWKLLTFYGPGTEYVQVTWEHADSARAFLNRIAGPRGAAKWSHGVVGLYNAVANTLGRQRWELVGFALLSPDGGLKSPSDEVSQNRPLALMTFKRKRER